MSDHWQRAFDGVYIPANACAAHLNDNFARLQSPAALDILDLGCGLGNPQVMPGVGIDADVGLGDSSRRRHGELQPRTGRREWMRV